MSMPYEYACTSCVMVMAVTPVFLSGSVVVLGLKGGFVEELEPHVRLKYTSRTPFRLV
jgi:hypothetical protein